MPRDFALYYAAMAADEAWSAELHRRFGKRAGDVRYTPQGRGEIGSELNRLYLEFRRTSDVWMQQMSDWREEARAAREAA